MLSNDLQSLKSDLLRLQRAGWLKDLQIYDNSGRLWYSLNKENTSLPFFSLPPCSSCHRTPKKTNPSALTVSLKNRPECLECHSREVKTLGFVTISLTSLPVKEIGKIHRKGLLIGYLSLLGVFLFFGGGYIHFFIVRRLKNIKNRLAMFRGQGWDPIVDNGSDEIGEIADSLNIMAEEITRIQKELAESRLYLKNLLDNMTNMVVVVDRNYKIQYANKNSLEYMGKTEPEVIGKECYRVFHGLEVPCHSEDSEKPRECGLLIAFQGKRHHIINSHISEKGLKYILVQYIPFYVGDEIPYAILMGMDITEHYKLNEQKKILGTYAEKLQSINRMEDFFQSLVNLGMDSLNADGCNVYLIDRKNKRLLRQSGLPKNEKLEDYLSEIGLDECVAAFAIQSGKTYIAETIDEFPNNRLKPIIKEAGYETIVSIPLKRDDMVVGVYNIAYIKQKAFRKSEEDFFSILTDTINTSFNRILQFKELEEHTERLTALTEIVRVLSKSDEKREVLEVITDALTRILKPDVSGIFLYNQDFNTLYPASIRGVDKTIYKNLVLHLERLDSEFNMKDNTFCSLNIFKSDRWKPLHEIASRLNVKSVYTRYLFTKKGKKLGLLIAFWQQEYLPNLDDIHFFNIFSNFAEIAIEKALLFEKVITEQRYWEETFKSFSDPLFITDRTFSIIKANRAFYKFIGNSVDVLGKKCHEVIQFDKHSTGKCPHYETVVTGKPSIKEIFDEDRGTHLIYTTSLIRGENGEISGIIHSIKDITFLKEMEKEKDRLHQQLLQAQKMESIGNLSGGIAHDFNNILTAIVGHTELAILKTKDSSIKGHLETIKCAADRAKEFTRQLLIFGKKAPMDRRVQDLNAVVEESMKLIKRIIGEDIAVVFKKAEEPLYVNIDRAQVTQVIMNLCVNARDAMPDGGTLTIETKRIQSADALSSSGKEASEYAVLKVSDTGVGIQKDIQHKIFDPFFTTKPEGKGSGLGLSVVYSVVDAHGGFIDLVSSPGKGSTFEIYLPVADICHIMSEDIIIDQTLPRGTEKILIVDDEKIIRETGRSILMALGYSVITASSGKEALEIFESDPEGFDLVISDQIMPEMKGTDLYMSMIQIKPNIPFILLTGYGKHLIQKDLKYRIKGIIEKPFNIKELAFKIRDALNGGTSAAV